MCPLSAVMNISNRKIHRPTLSVSHSDRNSHLVAAQNDRHKRAPVYCRIVSNDILMTLISLDIRTCITMLRPTKCHHDQFPDMKSQYRWLPFVSYSRYGDGSNVSLKLGFNSILWIRSGSWNQTVCSMVIHEGALPRKFHHCNLWQKIAKGYWQGEWHWCIYKGPYDQGRVVLHPIQPHALPISSSTCWHLRLGV